MNKVENEFGVMAAPDEREDRPRNLQSLTMHEVGHVLGIGWADDTEIAGIEHEEEVPGVDETVRIEYDAIPKGMEVYSGDTEGGSFEPDRTPEYIDTGDETLEPEWSIMMEGTAADTREFSDTADRHADQPVLAISIEELSTISFKAVPTQEVE